MLEKLGKVNRCKFNKYLNQVESKNIKNIKLICIAFEKWLYFLCKFHSYANSNTTGTEECQF